jgi:hypothetical protein
MLSKEEYSKYINELNSIEVRNDTDPFTIGVEEFVKVLDHIKQVMFRVHQIMMIAIQNRAELKSKYELEKALFDQKVNSILVLDESVRAEKSVESRRAAAMVKCNEDLVRVVTLEQDLFLAESFLSLVKRVYSQLRMNLYIMSEERAMFQVSLNLEGKYVKAEPSLKKKLKMDDEDPDENILEDSLSKENID